MSVIFGVCLPQNSIVDESSLLRSADATSRYGMDGTEVQVRGRIGMGFQAFHTHCRSRLEKQPVAHPLGNILVFDGRLDNHRELAATLEVNGQDVADSALVLEAFARWEADCFMHLVGDWALALWSAKDQVLYLARDHAGTRTLFYSNQRGEIKWSTYLETFLVDNNVPELNDEYVARVLSSQEIRDLTPYKGIQTVLPAHYISIRGGHETLLPHWRAISQSRIVYKCDSEYDEHFLHLFGQSVQRRTGQGAMILAELSGGMDSSSIVCMADRIFRDGPGRTDLLDTISYYDDTEPDWDERPYFSIIELHRKKIGIHIDCSSRIPTYEPLVLPDRIYPYPGGDRISLEVAHQFELSVGGGRYRAILSGVGGDELLGGVPTPMPELADYLRAGRLSSLLLRSWEWCQVTRQPLIQLLQEAFAFTCNLYREPRTHHGAVPPWLGPELRQICLRSRSRHESVHELISSRPSALAGGHTWRTALETLPHLTPNLLGCYEYRYPYLDRDLVDFLHQIPREQMGRPGRRRLLMRRALKTIVPAEILERKRKASMSHGPIANLRSAESKMNMDSSTGTHFSWLFVRR